MHSSQKNTVTNAENPSPASGVRFTSQNPEEMLDALETTLANPHLTESERHAWLLEFTQTLLCREEALLATLAGLAWMKDNTGHFLAVNQAMAQTCNLTPAAFPGKTDFDFYPPELAGQYQADDQEVMRSGQRKCVEEPYVGADGKTIWIETIKNPIRNSRGEIIGTVGRAKNITAQKETEARFQVLFNNTADAIFVHDANGNILDANRVACERLGYSHPDFLKLNVRDIDSPDHSSRAFQKFQNLKHEETILSETVHRARDGSLIPSEISAKAILFSGQPAILAISRDISERKHSEKLLHKILDSLHEAVFLIHAKSLIILGSNAAATAIFGFSREEFLGQTTEIFHIDRPSRQKFLEALFAALDSKGYLSNYEYQLKRKDGSMFYSDHSTYPLEDDDGQKICYVAVIRDITERKLIESENNQSQKLKSIGQLASGIAHEINTPIQYIGDNCRFLKDTYHQIEQLLNGYLALAAEYTPVQNISGRLLALRSQGEQMDLAYLHEEVPRAIEQSLEGVERVHSIVRAMKEFAHPGTQDKTLTDLNKIIENTVLVARNEWKYEAEVVLKLDQQLPGVYCLGGEIGQVILNMIVNASHAIAEKRANTSLPKGTITISTCQQDQWAEISLADTGAGIPEWAQAHIFDPFFTTKQVGKGTGQGLSISRNVIVEKHQGTLQFQTQAGVGTTFFIRIPIGMASKAATATG